MKLENIFFKYFFSPFLISIILSTIVLIIFLAIFTFNNYDKRLTKKIIELERNYSKTVINSANIIITNKFSKFQTILNEIIVFYQKKAKEILASEEEEELNTDFIKCLFTLDEDVCENESESEVMNMPFWFSDGYTYEDNLDEHKEVKNQLISFSYVIQNLNAIYESSKPNVSAYFFYFEQTDLYIS